MAIKTQCMQGIIQHFSTVESLIWWMAAAMIYPSYEDSGQFDCLVSVKTDLELYRLRIRSLHSYHVAYLNLVYTWHCTIGDIFYIYRQCSVISVCTYAQSNLGAGQFGPLLLRPYSQMPHCEYSALQDYFGLHCTPRFVWHFLVMHAMLFRITILTFVIHFRRCGACGHGKIDAFPVVSPYCVNVY